MLLLDEPTASLDADSSRSILEIISRINMVKKTTIVMVTHLREHAEKIAGKILFMENGNVK